MAFDMEEQFSEECVDSGIHEECGVFGAYDFDGNDIASTVYYGLFCSAAQRTGKLWYCSFGYQRPEKEHSGS